MKLNGRLLPIMVEDKLTTTGSFTLSNVVAILSVHWLDTSVSEWKPATPTYTFNENTRVATFTNVSNYLYYRIAYVTTDIWNYL